ncbi:MAG TPA: hypothetical protein VH639_23045 [Bryobacteraceae bacterium]|jgi:hypothetical protein
MSSQRKIDSARRNGALSKGPVTEAGKQASSQNGARHGILSQTVVLESESEDRFEELHAALLAEFQPRTTTEAALVETMVIARWRHKRVLGIQKAGFDLELERQTTPGSSAYRAAIVFKKLADTSRVLDLLHRYEVSFDRQFARALSLLLKLRAHSRQSALPQENSLFPTEPNPKIEHPSEAGPVPGSEVPCAELPGAAPEIAA